MLRLWQKVLLQAKKPGAIDANYKAQMKAQFSQLPFYAGQAKDTQKVYLNSFANRDIAIICQAQRSIAIALNAFKTEHGYYPQTLSQAESFWGKKFPLDPYSNQPFRYRRENHQYVLYSIGQDRIDDGGVKSKKYIPIFDRKDWIWGNYPAPQKIQLD